MSWVEPPQLWARIAHFLRHTRSRVRLGALLSGPWEDKGIAQGRVLSPLVLGLLIDGLAHAVHDSVPGCLQIVIGSSVARSTQTILSWQPNVNWICRPLWMQFQYVATDSCLSSAWAREICSDGLWTRKERP